ncbi:MAG: ribonuclease P protein component [Comamonadaceae bacterium]|nr:ribonuclease P protein component [Comamonadaceae bacterium]
MPQASQPRALRHLKKRQQFQQLLAVFPVAKTSHFCLHSLPAAQLAGGAGARRDALWVGVLLPKRWARHAVTRNLIRRQVYAVALEHCRSDGAGSIPAQAILVRLRGSFHAPREPALPPRQRHRPAASSALLQAATGTARQTPAPLRSAASDALRVQVRGQLQRLFTRAFASAPPAACPSVPQAGPDPSQHTAPLP